MKSVMQHSFSQAPTADIPRSSFDRSHGLKTTIDAGYLCLSIGKGIKEKAPDNKTINITNKTPR